MLDHDCVGLPGIGTFVAEEVPASFSDRGFTVNPPYRRLSFHSGRPEDDLLARFYALRNSVDIDAAKAIITQYLSEFKEVLKDRKSISLPGLGRLRATKENNFFFVPDQDLDIFPDGYGLQPVSLRFHQASADTEAIHADLPVFAPVMPSPAPAEPEAAVESAPVEPEHVTLETPAEPVASAPTEPEPAPAEPEATAPEAPATPAPVEPEPAAAAPEAPAEPEATTPEPAPEPELAPEAPATPAPVEPEPAVATIKAPAEPEPEPEPKPKPAPAPAPAPKPRRRFRWWIPLVVLLALAATALAVFMILVQVAPDFIDSILYTPEELRIINY